jgi:DNA-binding PadR family transcriptional regulator
VDLKYIAETDHAGGRKFYRLTEEGRKWIKRMTRQPPGK